MPARPDSGSRRITLGARLLLAAVILASCVQEVAFPAEAIEEAKGRTLSVRRDADSVSVFAREALVARYRHGGAIRKPYLAELALPGGRNVLLDSPPDHPHHHGIMLACRVEDVDFWAEGEKDGRESHVAFEPLRIKDTEGAEAAVLREKLRWTSADGRVLLEEERTLKVLAPEGSSMQVVLWQSRLAPPPGAKPVTLSGTAYHGLGMRFARSMDQDGTFVSAAGLTGVESTNGKEAAWCAYSAEVAPGLPVTAAIFDAPSNPRHPARWFTMREPFAYLSDTQTIGAKPVVLAPGESFVLRAAIVLFAGKADTTRIEEVYRKVSKAFDGKPPGPRKE